MGDFGMLFEITLSKQTGETVLQQNVDADDWNNALSTVLEAFKGNAMSSDAQSWNVTVKLLLSDA